MSRFVSLGLTLFAVLCWFAAFVAAQSRDAGFPPPVAGDIAGTNGYVGSEACQRCHENAYIAWRQSLHAWMTKPIEQAAVAGRFEDRYSISLARPDGPSERFPVHYTLGAKRFQGFLSRLSDGRLYVLPPFWSIEWQRWLDWKELTPVPDSPHDLRQIWNINCFNCHATNIVRNFDLSTRTFATTATEFGIGCEGCHGPGRAHIETTAAPDGGVAAFKQGGALKIFSPRFASARQVYDACAYCHGNKTNYFTGFTPGRRLEDFAQLSLMSERFPETDPQGDFWPDGRPSRFNRPQALTLSGCFIAGRATCSSCHEAHGSPNEHALKVPLAESARLCTQCHDALEEPAALTRHSRHPASSPGSDCVQCHMSEVNWRLLNRRRDHTFAPPVPELTAEFGIPNACTTCHENRTPEWAVEVMDTWYGDGARRRRAVAMTQTFYAASAGDRGVLERLGDLTIDRTHGALIRASAAGYIGRLASPSRAISPGTIQALIRASLDPEPMVRVAAVRALGTSGGDAAIPALAERLADTARVVRVSAAESLLYLGVTTGLGAALTAAQNEYADSLREFPDVAANHAALGWLLAARGTTDEAVRELRLAQSLDPRDAQPHVYLGVLAAREGRFDEAIEAWQAARRLNPDYPNIDRLIAEAERRQ